MQLVGRSVFKDVRKTAFQVKTLRKVAPCSMASLSFAADMAGIVPAMSKVA